MKKIIISAFTLCLAAVLFVAACKRPETEVTAAGKGGSGTLRITPQHHGENIDSCTVFIKYNTMDKPTGNYDEQVKCVMENGKPIATFSGLKKGNYYVYGEGWDESIGQKVAGGIPYNIVEEKSIDITVPVTEAGH